MEGRETASIKIRKIRKESMWLILSNTTRIRKVDGSLYFDQTTMNANLFQRKPPEGYILVVIVITLYIEEEKVSYSCFEYFVSLVIN
jgi:hypothetical protein